MIRRISSLVIFHGFIIYHEIKAVPCRIRFRFSKKNIEILKNKKPKKVIGEACVATALYAVATSLVRHAQDKIRKKREEKEED